MNHSPRRMKLAALFAVVLLLGLAVPATMAYMSAKSNTLHNTFGASYVAPDGASVRVQVEKTVLSSGAKTISPQGFTFLLESADGKQSHTLKTDAQGRASAELTFTDADLGREHHYTLREVNDKRENIVYDDTVYAVDVALHVDADNRIVAEAKLDGKPVATVVAAFKNVYNAAAAIPHTGDDSDLMLFALLLIASVTGMALLRRRAENK